jgi:hypothetical protein
MPDDFNPYQPQTPIQGGAIPSGQRPVVATVFGILNLVFGILGVCGNLASGGGFIAITSGILDAEMKADMNLQQFDDPVFFGLLIMQLVLGFILSVIIIISGVGLLQFKPWGRKLANFYAIAYLILLVVGLAINIVFTVMPAIHEANIPDANPQQIGGAIGGIVGGILGICFGAIYPICILVFLNRRQFVNQIENA